jgi:hypothetical protein
MIDRTMILRRARIAQIVTVCAVFGLMMALMTGLAGVDPVYGFFFLPHAILLGSSTIPTSLMTRAVVGWDAGRGAQLDDAAIRAKLELAATAVAAAEAELRPDLDGATVVVRLPTFADARGHGEIMRTAALRLIWRRRDGSRYIPAGDASAETLAARIVFREDPEGRSFARARVYGRPPIEAEVPIERPSAHARLRLAKLMAEIGASEDAAA